MTKRLTLSGFTEEDTTTHADSSPTPTLSQSSVATHAQQRTRRGGGAIFSWICRSGLSASCAQSVYRRSES